METEQIKAFFRNDRFAANAGVELLEVREGYAKASLTITPEHLGCLCEGALSTMTTTLDFF